MTRKLLTMACFAGLALSSLPALAAGPSSAASPAGLDSLPLSLRDSLSLPMSEPSSQGDAAFAASTAEAGPAAGEALSSLEGGAQATPSAALGEASAGGESAASAALGFGQGASPMLVSPSLDAQPLGGGVAEALAGMNGGAASPMVGDGLGGSPLFLSHGRSSGGGWTGGVMTMSAWSTSW